MFRNVEKGFFFFFLHPSLLPPTPALAVAAALPEKPAGELQLPRPVAHAVSWGRGARQLRREGRRRKARAMSEAAGAVGLPVFEKRLLVTGGAGFM